MKFTTEEGGQSLRIGLIEKIKSKLPDTFLVLHGSSSIPPEAVATINRFGGILPESYGIATEQKREGIGSGIRKINQGTDSHLTWTAALRQFLSENPSDVEPSAAIGIAMAAMTGVVALRMREFGSSQRSS